MQPNVNHPHSRKLLPLLSPSLPLSCKWREVWGGEERKLLRPLSTHTFPGKVLLLLLNLLQWPVGPWSKMEKYPFLLVKYSIIIATWNGAVSLAEKMDGENKHTGFPSPLLLQMCTNLVEHGGTRFWCTACQRGKYPGEVKPSQYYALEL